MYLVIEDSMLRLRQESILNVGVLQSAAIIASLSISLLTDFQVDKEHQDRRVMLPVPTTFFPALCRPSPRTPRSSGPPGARLREGACARELIGAADPFLGR